MLSPFLAHLLEHVSVFNAYVISSKAKDSSWITGWGRSKELSSLQQEYATNLYNALKKIAPSDSTDEAVFVQLQKLVKDLITKTRRAVAEYKGPDQISWLLMELSLFETRLESAYRYYTRYSLMDQRLNDNPVIIFKTALCNYLINKAVYKYALEIGYYAKTGWLRSWTYDETLSARKDTIVLDFLDKEYLDTSRRAMMGHIRDILQQDKDILDRQKIAASVPVGVGMIKIDVPVSLIYNPKTLSDELKAALKLLERSEFTTSPVSFSTNHSTRASSMASSIRQNHVASPPPPIAEVVVPRNDDDNDDAQSEHYYSDNDLQ